MLKDKIKGSTPKKKKKVAGSRQISRDRPVLPERKKPIGIVALPSIPERDLESRMREIEKPAVLREAERPVILEPKEKPKKPKKPKKSLVKRLLKWGAISIPAGILAGFLGFYGLTHLYLRHTSDITLEKIKEGIKQESLITDREGKPLAALGGGAHDHIEELEIDPGIPNDLEKAFLAWEDTRFYDHNGFDDIGFARAMLTNLKKLGFVQGGSGITQQLVKYYTKKTEKSVWRKLAEIGHALRLEDTIEDELSKKYKGKSEEEIKKLVKKEILETYLNSIPTSKGNIRGVANASKLYFNKELKELNLRQMAAIAGTVQRPGYFNPFREKGRKRIEKRANAVLKRMLAVGFISEKKYNEAVKMSLDVEKGSFPFDTQPIIVEMIREELEENGVKKRLEELGITDLGTAGLNIETFIDPGVQGPLEDSVKKVLSEKGILLSSYKLNVDKRPQRVDNLEQGEFYYGEISDIIIDGKNLKGKQVECEGKNKYCVKVKFGPTEGLIDYKGLKRIVSLMEKNRRGRTWAKVGKKDVKKFLQKLKALGKGSTIYCSVRDFEEKSKQALLDVEQKTQQKPGLGGAAVVLEDGNIAGIVGNFDNETTDMNYALAGRPAGSTFKPILYSIALKYGWEMGGNNHLLKNKNSVFWDGDLFYYPKNDDSNPPGFVPMWLAGVTSQNQASVQLLYRMLDKLSNSDIEQLAREHGFGPAEEENYSRKAMDKFRVFHSSRERLEEIEWCAFEEAKRKMLYSGEPVAEIEQLLEVLNLEYPIKEDRFKIQINKDKNIGRKRKARLLRSRQWNYKSALRKSQAVNEKIGQIKSLLGSLMLEEGIGQEILANLYYDEKSTDIFYHSSQPSGKLPLTLEVLLNRNEREQIDLDNILIEGKISLKVLNKLTELMEEEKTDFDVDNLFNLQTLVKHPVFRAKIAQRMYADRLRDVGIEGKIKEGLSMPLGHQDVSPLNLAQVFERLVTGKVYTGPDGKPHEPALIRKIRLADGTLVYEHEYEVDVVELEEITFQIRQILHGASVFGTSHRLNGMGYKIEGDVQEYIYGALLIKENSDKVRIPAGGKTGTSQDQRDSRFVGFLGKPDYEAEKGSVDSFDPKNVYIVTAWVGDFNPTGKNPNQSMKKGSIRIYSTQGGVPIIKEASKDIIKEKKYNEYVNLFELISKGYNIVPMEESVEADNMLIYPPHKKTPQGIVGLEVDPKECEPELFRHPPRFCGDATENYRIIYLLKLPKKNVPIETVAETIE
ncbi:transglycosylase domain-containing protein [Candidatus Woesearchaeota archaeon]|nr:transglycosylase domain-containing protein [Candidatus Woesearchaeota archaeon]